METMETIEYKRSVLRLLDNKSDLIGYDFRVSLLVSALNSYRCDSVLKPFPNQYIDDNNEKRFDFLKTDINCIPSLYQLDTDYQMSDNCWKLLHWIMTLGSFNLIRRPIDSEELSNILNANQLSMKNYKPTHVFQVVSQPKTAFCSAKQRFGSFWAFHGSLAENLHSIIHNGLVNHLNKRNLYGSGTYLSSQLSVAIEFSPFGFGWTKSCLGREISCIAVCEVVKHPEITAQNSTNGVPNAYYVVRNDDMINVSYVLVYCKQRARNTGNQKFFDGLIASNVYKYRSSIVLFSLLLVLIAIGFKFS